MLLNAINYYAMMCVICARIRRRQLVWQPICNDDGRKLIEICRRSFEV